MPRVAFDAFSVDVPRGWSDITETLEGDHQPCTLAHRDGVGALQFSVALYRSGVVPDPTPEVLSSMVHEFGKKQGLAHPSKLLMELGPPRLAAGSFAWGKDFLRVWHISDGRNFALVTYTCAAEDAGPEVVVCEQIVRSIAFAGA
jgi:hypothetical protein